MKACLHCGQVYDETCERHECALGQRARRRKLLTEALEVAVLLLREPPPPVEPRPPRSGIKPHDNRCPCTHGSGVEFCACDLLAEDDAEQAASDEPDFARAAHPCPTCAGAVANGARLLGDDDPLPDGETVTACVNCGRRWAAPGPVDYPPHEVDAGEHWPGICRCDACMSGDDGETDPDSARAVADAAAHALKHGIPPGPFQRVAEAASTGPVEVAPGVVVESRSAGYFSQPISGDPVAVFPDYMADEQPDDGVDGWVHFDDLHDCPTQACVACGRYLQGDDKVRHDPSADRWYCEHCAEQHEQPPGLDWPRCPFCGELPIDLRDTYPDTARPRLSCPTPGCPAGGCWIDPSAWCRRLILSAAIEDVGKAVAAGERVAALEAEVDRLLGELETSAAQADEIDRLREDCRQLRRQLGEARTRAAGLESALGEQRETLLAAGRMTSGDDPAGGEA